MSIVSIEVETPELNTAYTTPEQWTLIQEAQRLLALAGATACIWTHDDLAERVAEDYDDLTQAELDAIVTASWPRVERVLSDATESDWETISTIISDAVASGAHREKVAA